MFSPDELLVIAADSEGTVSIFDADTGRRWSRRIRAQAEVPARLAFEPISHEGRLTELMVSWDGHYLMTSTATQARIWDLSVGRALTLPIVHEGELFAARFTPDNGRSSRPAAGASSGMMPSRWRNPAPPCWRMPNPQTIRIGNRQQRAHRPDGRADRALRGSNRPSAKPVVFQSPSAISQMVFSPDENHFALGTADGVRSGGRAHREANRRDPQAFAEASTPCCSPGIRGI